MCGLKKTGLIWLLIHYYYGGDAPPPWAHGRADTRTEHRAGRPGTLLPELDRLGGLLFPRRGLFDGHFDRITRQRHEVDGDLRLGNIEVELRELAHGGNTLTINQGDALVEGFIGPLDEPVEESAERRLR